MKPSGTVLGCVAALLVGGCLSGADRSSQRYYVLEDTGVQVQRATVVRASSLLVAPPTTSTFYDTQDISYSRAPGTRAYYQNNFWTERPGQMIGDLLVARLEQGGAFRTVAKVTSGVQGDLLLTSHLLEFYHDAAIEPGSVRILLTAELVDPARRTLVARSTFSRSVPVLTYDASGAVKAFNQGLKEILDDVSVWIGKVAPL